MRISRIYLRWYKSFNISYRREGPARLTSQPQPWNRLFVGDALSQYYPFIEISIEPDITTIVGGNESGKSHLLSAVSKVLTGKGIDGHQFLQTDLCRYSTVPECIEGGKRWANLGVRLEAEAESDDLIALLRKGNISDFSHPKSVVLIVGGPDNDVGGHVFIEDGPTSRKLKPDEVEAIRSFLPRIEFIDAKSALPDHLTFNELALALGSDSDAFSPRYPQGIAQDAAAFVSKIALDPKVPPADSQIRELQNLQRQLVGKRENMSDDAKLAVLLLRDVLGISPETILAVLQQSLSERGFIDYHLNDWNKLIADRLNLRKFWRQDDNAALTLRYRDGILYFDITDKTGATYTFKERSSGLRFFLSYYIQAKAMELSARNRNAIILMDEPDSFLSILGQRNLLAVFESLVSYESSAQNCQLIYTTHSPFLINQNFPRRIRVVTKEEAEEGTQYQGKASSRRYEPVRSALGINCAQTLFMGATNLVLEGPTDQYLITEIIRARATPETVSQWLDLNSIAIVSADGVDNVERVLSASQWGDEPIPATVVVIDSDRKDVIKKITGMERGFKQLIDSRFAVTLNDLVHEKNDPEDFQTIEDLIPWSLYGSCFAKYLERWAPSIFQSEAGKIQSGIQNAQLKSSTVKRCENILTSIGIGGTLDKLGVLIEVVNCLGDSGSQKYKGEIDLLTARVQRMCRKLNEIIDHSRQIASSRSVANTVKRLIREFLQSRDKGCSVVDFDNLMIRIERETRTIDDASSESLRAVVLKIRAHLDSLSQAGQTRIHGNDWGKWKANLDMVKRNPFSTDLNDNLPVSSEAVSGKLNESDGKVGTTD